MIHPCFYKPNQTIDKGKGNLVLQNENYSLYPGRAFVYEPGISQDIATDPNDLLVKYFVEFMGTEAEKILKKTNYF